MSQRIVSLFELPAQCQRNLRSDAIGTLLEAEQLAPEQVRVHFLTGRLVRSLVRTERGRPSSELAAFATRVRALI
ncbi:hypothetical protein [Lentzea sp. NBRC 105346]|uniref:hypothetical protein n=1 Tax=Lentzea sp. NBRC 105346 TaxID=3032205 RepID=UPI002557C3DA|nr:hypothetical protein [Lentzea sp. NBRC 105346]